MLTEFVKFLVDYHIDRTYKCPNCDIQCLKINMQFCPVCHMDVKWKRI